MAQPKHILIASPMIAESALLSYILRDEGGYRVGFSSNAADVQVRLLKGGIDLMITDTTFDESMQKDAEAFRGAHHEGMGLVKLATQNHIPVGLFTWLDLGTYGFSSGESSDTKVDYTEIVMDYFREGARFYLTSAELGSDHILAAVQAALSGGVYIPQRHFLQLLKGIRRPSETAQPVPV